MTGRTRLAIAAGAHVALMPWAMASGASWVFLIAASSAGMGLMVRVADRRAAREVSS